MPWRNFKGTHPSLADTDGDELSDREETENYDTDPTLVDTDGDGYEDAQELIGGYSPTDDSEYPGWNVVPVNYVDALNAQASGGGRATATGLISYSLIGTFAAPPMVGNVGFSSLHGFIYLANPPTGDPGRSIPMGMDCRMCGNCKWGKSRLWMLEKMGMRMG